MTSKGAARWLNEVDQGKLLRHQLAIIDATFFRTPPHAHQCDVDACGGLFMCHECDRFVGWCLGAADDEPGLCDECWSVKHRKPGGAADRNAIPVNDLPKRGRKGR